MKKILVACLLAAGLTLMGTPAHAFGKKKADCCCAPCAPTTSCCAEQVSYETKTITCYKEAYTTQTVSYTVNKVVPRQVVENVTKVVCVPEYRDEVRTCTEMVKQPRCIEKEVCRTRWVKETVTDCCGHCHTVCKPCTVVEKRTCTVWECVPVTKSYTVRVCCMKQVPQVVQCTKTVYDCVPTTETREITCCKLVPHTYTIQVPVRCGCAATTCSSCANTTCCK